MQSQEATCRRTRPELDAILKDIDVTTDDATRKRMFERYFVADSKPPRCITTGCPFGEIGKHPASVEQVPVIFVLKGHVLNARQCIGVRKRVFEYAADNLAFHPHGETCGIIFNNRDSRDKTLAIHLLFESKENALRCYQKVFGLQSELSLSITVELLLPSVSPNELNGEMVLVSQYKPHDSPQPLSPSDSSVTTNFDNSELEELFATQGFEIVDPPSKPVHMHIIPKEKINDVCGGKRGRDGHAHRNPNNLLAGSAMFHDLFDGKNVLKPSIPHIIIDPLEVFDEKILTVRITFVQNCHKNLRLRPGLIECKERDEHGNAMFVAQMKPKDIELFGICLGARAAATKEAWKKVRAGHEAKYSGEDVWFHKEFQGEGPEFLAVTLSKLGFNVPSDDE